MHKSHRCWCRVLSSSPHLCPQVSIALISFLETMLLIYLSYKVRSPAPCPRGKQRSVPIASYPQSLHRVLLSPISPPPTD